MRFVVCLLLAGTLAASAPAAETLHLTSGPDRLALLELFTSEGCSSCPPADQWLSRLRSTPGLWRDFVPVAFHVNYWDQLGWKDRLASRAATEREYAHAAAWGTRSVYTPCFVLNGAEWHPGGLLPGRSSTNAGVLTVDWQEGLCRIHFSPPPGLGGASLDAHTALLGSGLTSQVTAGENRGATLTHNFVALALGAGPLLPREQNECEAQVSLAAAAVAAPQRALAVWVSRRGESTPVQAAGGWLPTAAESK